MTALGAGTLFRGRKRNTPWALNLRVNGARFKSSTGTRDLAAAKLIACEMVDSWLRSGSIGVNAKHLYSMAFKAARARAKKRGIRYELDADAVARLITRSGGRCELTGAKFSDEVPVATAHKKCPFAPSLDRVDSTGGYVEGNVRLVCVAVNFAMNQWGDSVITKLAEAMAMTGKISVKSLCRAAKLGSMRRQ